MRKRACICMLSLILGLAALGAQGRPGPAPRVEFDELEYDFGEIYQYEEEKYSFVFRNTGNAPLKIEKVRSTCGCAPVVVGKTVLPPGGRGEIEVTFKAGGLRGAVVKHVYVDTNDPALPRVNLKVSAEVKVELELRPRGVYIGRLPVGEKMERVVELSAVEAPSFRILEVSATHPDLRVRKPVKIDAPLYTYRLTIEIGPVKEPQRINAKVIVRTDLPHSSEVAIPMYGKIVAGGVPR